MNPAVVITDRAKKRLKGKHPWIFSNEVASKPEVSAGEQVEIRDASGHLIGTGYYNPRTLIAVRIFSYRNHFNLRDRIQEALRRREDSYEKPVYRLIYSESDGLPGLIADRYEGTLVLQILTAGMERMTNEILEALQEMIKPERILLRNDSSYRTLEGLPLRVSWVHGEPSEEIIETDGIRFSIPFESGQKTGFFLDQQENRRRLLRYGTAQTMLDLFCYSGAWSLYGAKAGITGITAVDSSQDAINATLKNAALNNCSITTVVSDVMPFLRSLYGNRQRYDRIILDPPAFCKSKKQLPPALRGYRKINLRAMKLLARHGLLFTCSCSQPVTPDLFLQMLRQAASDSGRSFQLKEFLLHPPDHPVLLGFPESLYLKCAILQAL